MLLLACAILHPGDTSGKGADFDWSEEEEAVHELINAHRAGLGLAELSLHAAIGAPAREHSQAMLSGEADFSHDGFEERVEAIELTIELAAAGENVGFVEGYAEPAEGLVAGWLKSAGHRENIEGSWDLTGVGIAAEGATVYATQIFVLSR